MSFLTGARVSPLRMAGVSLAWHCLQPSLAWWYISTGIWMACRFCVGTAPGVLGRTTLDVSTSYTNN